MSWIAIILLLGFLVVNELVNAYAGAKGGKKPGRSWMRYAIALLVVVFIYVTVQQIGNYLVVRF